MKRSDGRDEGIIRDPHFGLDVLKSVDGSARFVCGKSEVLVMVYGPGPAKSKQEKTDRATVQVTVQTLSYAPSKFESFND